MSAMNAEEARERFGDAVEGSLGEAKAAFEAALAADDALREEFALYRQLFGGTEPLAPAPADAPPALLGAVQRKIRTRSQGRFFKDRFASEGAGGGPALSLVLGMAVLVLVAASIVIVQQLVIVELP
jgi:hypothetical protein